MKEVEAAVETASVFDTKLYLRLQEIIVLSPKHRWFAGEAVGHNPTIEELWRYWIKSKDAEKIRLRIKRLMRARELRRSRRN